MEIAALPRTPYLPLVGGIITLTQQIENDTASARDRPGRIELVQSSWGLSVGDRITVRSGAGERHMRVAATISGFQVADEALSSE